MGSRVAPEFVGGQLPRSLTLALQHLAKETLSRLLVSFLRHENIDHVTVLIHCSPKVVKLSVDLDEDFVHKPVITKSAPLPSQGPSEGWAELAAPVSNRLIGNSDATLSEQISRPGLVLSAVMALKCSVCQHAVRDALDSSLIRGGPLRNLAGRHGLSSTALHRHKNCRLASNPRAPLEVGDASGAVYRERGHTDGVGVDEWVAYEYAKVRRLYVKLGIGDRTRIEFFEGGYEIHGVGTYEFLHRHLDWPSP